MFRKLLSGIILCTAVFAMAVQMSVPHHHHENGQFVFGGECHDDHGEHEEHGDCPFEIKLCIPDNQLLIWHTCNMQELPAPASFEIYLQVSTLIQKLHSVTLPDRIKARAPPVA